MTVARYIADNDMFFAQGDKGTFTIRRTDDGQAKALLYTCPCADPECTVHGKLYVGERFKPPEMPSWNWNGSTDAPTLTPSVNHVGHWHGFLTDGVWITAA